MTADRPRSAAVSRAAPSSSPRRRAVRLAIAAGFAAVAVAVWLSGAAGFLSFESLRDHREALQEWVAAHGLGAALLFMAVYCLAVSVSLPGAVWLTLTGGFLFGTAAGAAYAVAGATGGAVVLFLLARTVFRDAWSRRVGGAMARMEEGFRRDAFSYLLVLRLVPLFPFWLVNLVPALLGMRLLPFAAATALGIIPGAVVYAAVGNGLDAVFAQGGTPDLSLVWSPQILMPLIGLAALALIPVIHKRWRSRRGG